MKNRDTKLFLQDILDSIEKIEKYTAALSFEEFINNTMVIDAVTRNFEIIGEAAKFISSEYSELPLKEMVGMRNILIHNYLGVDYEYVWQSIKEDLPKAKNLIMAIIKYKGRLS